VVVLQGSHAHGAGSTIKEEKIVKEPFHHPQKERLADLSFVSVESSPEHVLQDLDRDTTRRAI
jgi:hypothetical protein